MKTSSKSRANLTEKQKKAAEKRQYLISLSRKIRQAMDAGKIPADQKINDVLLEAYAKQFGQSEFHTFAEWKKKGFHVKKGEKASLIWAKPRKMTKTVETENGSLEEEYQRFPICYLFHRGQVEASAQNEAA